MPVGAIAFSYNNQLVVSGLDDKTVPAYSVGYVRG